MYEDDAVSRREIAKYAPADYKGVADEKALWAHEGYVSEDWVAAMWKKHRTDPGMPPTDGWKQAKENANGLVLPKYEKPAAASAPAANP